MKRTIWEVTQFLAVILIAGVVSLFAGAVVVSWIWETASSIWEAIRVYL